MANSHNATLSPTETDCLLPHQDSERHKGFVIRLREFLADKENKIMIFIAVDFVFFLLELFVGYAAHSLALVADAFHMLNDIISLFVGLWAVRKAKSGQADAVYTYGWARVELLGGLMNGVFLVALCLSIFLESIQRFVEPQKVQNPKLVLIIGGVGLFFNIVGLFVFHQHSHSHDDEQGIDDDGHMHHHDGPVDMGGHDHAHSPTEHKHSSSPGGHSSTNQKQTMTPRRSRNLSVNFSVENERFDNSHISHSLSRADSGHQRRSGSQGQIDLPINPSGIRSSISNYAAALSGRPDIDDSSMVPSADEDIEAALHQTEFATNPRDNMQPFHRSSPSRASSARPKVVHNPVDHSEHLHKTKPAATHGGHGHNHGDMNIRGIFLHVVGDALGNIGVMVSALIIWLAHGEAKYYADPAISLLITGILLHTAIPLCIATAKPLLQASPQHISINDIETDVTQIPGVKSCHDMHVWALTPTKYIATFHVCLDFEFDKTRRNQYMEIARDIKTCLHGFGIHSSTVQPEFLADDHGQEDPACLLNCDDGCITGRQCCPPVKKQSSGTGSPQ